MNAVAIAVQLLAAVFDIVFLVALFKTMANVSAIRSILSDLACRQTMDHKKTVKAVEQIHLDLSQMQG